MTAIINGKITKSGTTKSAFGGTELMAQRMIDHFGEEYLSQFTIVHSRFREEIKNLRINPKRNILVLHDLPEDPMYDTLHESLKYFGTIVCVSQNQMESFHRMRQIPYSKMMVIPNCIEPFDDVQKKNDKIRLIYHTTPHRGLEFLLPVLKFADDNGITNWHLDVFSSFDIYGWGERDEAYKQVFEDLEAHENVTNHGFQPNDVVREALKEAHIFAYPCRWKETSCLAAIEAMSARALVVATDYGALRETTGNLGILSRYSENAQEMVNWYAMNLITTMKLLEAQPEALENHTSFVKRYADLTFTSKFIFENKWRPLFTSLLK